MEEDIVQHNITDLMRAATEPDPSTLIKMLASDNYRASLFQKDRKGRTALDWARMCRNYVAVSLLMKAMAVGLHDARVEAVSSAIDMENYMTMTNSHQAEMLMNAIKERNALQAMRVLNENRLYRDEVNAVGQVFFADTVGYYGFTPLIMACGMNIVEVVCTLLNLEVPLESQNIVGHTAFTFACAAGNSSIVRALLFHGANVFHQTAEGRTGLHYACLYAKVKTVQTIFDYMIESFATFRIEGHSQIEFDYTRWIKYAEILDRLINLKDNRGMLASQMVPAEPVDPREIETKLMLRRVKSLGSLKKTKLASRVQDADERSIQTNRNFAHESTEIDTIDYEVRAPPSQTVSNLNEYSASMLLPGESIEIMPQLPQASSIEEGDLIAEETGVDENGIPFMLQVNSSVSFWGGGEENLDDELSLSTNQSGSFVTSFTHDTDNMHAIDIHNIREVSRNDSTYSQGESLTTIEKIFSDAKDRILVWIDSAEKEKELSRLVPCALNCGQMCTVEMLTTHVRDDCPYREVQCLKCRDLVQFCQLKYHNNRKCVKRIVGCPNAYQGCRDMLTYDNLESHLHIRCIARPVCCRQLCESVIPLHKRDSHEQEHCKNRIIHCDQCNEELIANQYTDHLHNLCPERLVKCSISCGSMFKAKDVTRHESEDCVKPCMWNCGEIIGPVERRKFHEYSICRERIVACRFDCNTPLIRQRDITIHENIQCDKRPLICANGCGALLCREVMNAHTGSWCGDCPERLMRCPSNLIGWKIRMLADYAEGIVTNYKRSSPLDGHYNRSDYRGVDQLYVRFPQANQWIDFWEAKFILLTKAQDLTDSKILEKSNFDCGWIVASSMNNHLNRECLHRQVYVSGKEDAVVQYKGQKSELRHAIAVADARNKLDDHIAASSVTTMIICEYCALSLPESKMKTHHQTDCVDFPLRCPFGCGEIVLKKLLDKHIGELCPKRPVICGLCNNNDLWAEELPDHDACKCPMRATVCPLACGVTDLHMSNIDKHNNEDCVNRPVMCTCGYTMPHHELDEHLRLHCVDRDIFCPQGCGMLLALTEVEQHVEFLCANKHFRYQKIVDCPNGCGIRMMIRDIQGHINYQCEKRLVECSLLCGTVVQMDRLKSHLCVCPMRVISCDGNIKSCERILHRWFYREPKGVDTHSFSLINHQDGPPLETGDHMSVGSFTHQDTFSRVGNSLINNTLNESSMVDGSSRPNNFRSNNATLQYNPNQSGTLISVNSGDPGGLIENEDSLLLPLFSINQGQEPVQATTLYKTETFEIEFAKKATLFQSVKIKKPVNKGVDLEGDTAMEDAESAHEGQPGKLNHPSVQTSTSSIYKEGHQIRLHNEIRMFCCRRHQVTLITAAVRYNDFTLAEYLMKQCKECEDIDHENTSGDTALTLACRLGRADFVELLLQHGSDVNKETSAGKTALIESAKAEVENNQILEYLIKAGSIVAYKTAKHRKSALNWAKKMDRPMSIRILELAAVVQKQSNMLFQAISCGKYDGILKLIEDGDLFDPNTEAKCYEDMIQYGTKLDENDAQLKRVKRKMVGLTDAVEAGKAKADEYKSNLQQAIQSMESSFVDQDTVSRDMSKEFGEYERIALKLTGVDIEEIKSLSKPQPILRLSMFVYALMFEILPSEKYPDTAAATTVEGGRKWWSEVMKTFEKANVIARRIQSFSMDRVEKDRFKPLVDRAMQLFLDLHAFLEPMRKRTKKSKKDKNHNEFRTITDVVLAAVAKKQQEPPTTAATLSTNDSVTESYVSLEKPVNNGRVLEDWEWDSDAEDGGGGDFIKGEWVPKTKRKEKWWEHTNDVPEQQRPSSQQSTGVSALTKPKTVYVTDSVIQEEMKKFNDATTVVALPSVIDDNGSVATADRTVISSVVVGPEGSLELDNVSVMSESSQPRSGANSPSRKSKRRNTSSSRKGKGNVDTIEDTINSICSKKDVTIGLSVDDIECFPFVDAMYHLLKAVVKYKIIKPQLLEVKTKASENCKIVEELRNGLTENTAKYNENFKIRAKVEAELIDNMKKVRALQQKTHACREKVRVARLMNQVSVSGHTLISWAAATGAFEVVESALSHGATVGYPAHLLHMTASFIQYSYRIYKMYAKSKEKAREIKKAAWAAKAVNDTNNMGQSQGKLDSIELIRETNIIKELRGKLLNNLNFQRSKLRFPIPEAIYAGKWEIISRIFERRMWHVHFSNSWIFPSPPTPFLRRLEHQYDHFKLSALEVLAHGMNDLSAGVYTAESGWVPPHDPRDPYGETQTELNRILAEVEKKRQKFLSGRFRLRALANEKRNQIAGELEMASAVQNNDYRRCIFLAERKGITIDFETPEGFTVLLWAAEEDVNAVNHSYMVNDDGRPCLVVEYLLDRLFYRPAVDLETKSGHTALIRAVTLGRGPVVEALLDRGANIDYQNRFGKTALHYAAKLGNTECTRMLIERFANQSLKDNDGLTPYEVADRENFTNIMKLLSQFEGGFLGPVQISRGRVNNTVSCPLGCGEVMIPKMTEEHCLVCHLRGVPCPLDCGVTNLMMKEVPDHTQHDCIKRIVQCEDCEESVEFRYLNGHKKGDCVRRIVPCSLLCGKRYPFNELKRHMATCNWRIIKCKLQCPMEMTINDSEYHMANICENRRVPCPLRCRGLIVCKLVDLHVAEQCPNRVQQCVFCNVTMLKKEIGAHEVCCTKRKEPCTAKCGELVHLDEMQQHIVNCCRFRFVDCDLLCGRKVRVADMNTHQETECPQRLVPCEYGCVVSELVAETDRVVTTLLAKVMSLHLKFDCPERLNRCSLCLEQVKARHTTAHDSKDCAKRVVHCRVTGCLKELPFCERDEHERFKCRFRFISCAQGCGENLIVARASIHMTKHCTRRFLNCTLGCGMNMRFDELAVHLEEECLRRHTGTANSGSDMLRSSSLPSITNGAANAEKVDPRKKISKSIVAVLKSNFDGNEYSKKAAANR